jgi:hypothetical protein
MRTLRGQEKPTRRSFEKCGIHHRHQFEFGVGPERGIGESPNVESEGAAQNEGVPIRRSFRESPPIQRLQTIATAHLS